MFNYNYSRPLTANALTAAQAEEERVRAVWAAALAPEAKAEAEEEVDDSPWQGTAQERFWAAEHDRRDRAWARMRGLPEFFWK